MFPSDIFSTLDICTLLYWLSWDVIPHNISLFHLHLELYSAAFQWIQQFIHQKRLFLLCEDNKSSSLELMTPSLCWISFHTSIKYNIYVVTVFPNSRKQKIYIWYIFWNLTPVNFWRRLVPSITGTELHCICKLLYYWNIRF
jgi:hypothetical protein